jgi:phosphinothricin acetyltransferase
MQIIQCGESYSPQILAILNDAIVNTTALYDYEPRSPDSMAAWFAAKRSGNFPVIGAVTESGELMGFASYGVFRPWPAYKYTVEHSVYIAASHRGRGIGRTLLRRVIDEAQSQDYHVLIGCIDSQNPASVALHKAMGFQYVGTLRQVGFKFGGWLDLQLHQLILTTPRNPLDG